MRSQGEWRALYQAVASPAFIVASFQACLRAVGGAK